MQITAHFLRNMKRVAIPFLFLYLTLIPAFASEERQVVIAADPWCPYNCTPESKSPGYLIELAQTVFQPHGYTIKYMNLPWARALKYAKEGTIHAAVGAVRGNISGHYIGEVALGKDETILVVRKGEYFNYTGISAFGNKKLGVITNYTYDNNGEIDRYIYKLRQQSKGGVSVLHQETAVNALFNMLLSRKIDVFPENRYVALYKARELGVSDQIEIITTGKADDIFIAFTPNNEGEMLSKMLDEGINLLRKNGKLKSQCIILCENMLCCDTLEMINTILMLAGH